MQSSTCWRNCSRLTYKTLGGPPCGGGVLGPKEAVQFQGPAVVATAKPHDRKVQRLAGGPDTPAEVTVGKHRRQKAKEE